MRTAARRIVRWAVIVMASLAAPFAGAAAHAQQASLEYQVKATFLYRFASFVTWPAESFAAPGAPLNLCVVGADPFNGALEAAVRGQQIGGRAVAVRHLRAYQPGEACHILYARAGQQGVEQALRAARGQPVLTVTDAEDSGARGMVHFTLVDNRVRFHIDDARAAESNLSISSRLLDLAVSVRRRAGA